VQVCAQLYTGMQIMHTRIQLCTQNAYSISMLERVLTWYTRFTKINVYVHSHAFLYAYEPDSLYGRVYIHYVNYYIR